MSKFKLGDRVRIVKDKPPETRGNTTYIGKEFVIENSGGELDGENTWYGGDLSASKPWRWRDSELELVDGPVRYRNVPEIVAGKFNGVTVRPYGQSAVYIEMGGAAKSASDLTAAIGTLTTIRDAMLETANG